MLLFLYVFYVERKARKQPKKVFIALIHSIVTHLSGKSEIYVSYNHFTKVVAQKLFLSLALSLQDFPNLHHLYAHAIFIVFSRKNFSSLPCRLHSTVSSAFSNFFFLLLSKIIIQKCLYLKNITGKKKSHRDFSRTSLDIDDCYLARSFMREK